jgi:hypothetical protein
MLEFFCYRDMARPTLETEQRPRETELELEPIVPVPENHIDLPNLPLSLISSNSRKYDRFKEALTGYSTTQTEPLFDESEIKENLSVSQVDGIPYAVEISQRKLKTHRELAQSREEQTNGDEILVTSDSVLLVKTEKGLEAVPTSLSPDQQREYLALINESGEVIFSGVATYGRKKGKSAFSITSYVCFPLGEPIQALPVDFKALQKSLDPQREIVTGYIQAATQFTGPTLTNIHTAESFDQARSYISGLTPEALQTIRETSSFEAMVAPIVEDLLRRHAYNTLSFHNHFSGDPAEYRQLIANYEPYFEQFGGNCTLFTLELVKRLSELDLDIKIIVYPAETRDFKHQQGHSGLLIRSGNNEYVFDPGLGIPYPLPISAIPVAPVECGNKQVMISLRDLDMDHVPDILIQRKRGPSVIYAQELCTPERFADIIPQILSEIHNHRPLFKYTFHDESGVVQIEWIFDRSSHQLEVKNDQGKIWQGSLPEYFSHTDLRAFLQHLCTKREIPLTTIDTELQLLEEQYGTR